MRLSVRRNDPGYHPEAFGAEVYLDGQIIDDCITADEEKGEVFILKRNTLGEYIINAEGANIAEERKTGKVQIIVPAGFKPTAGQL